MRLLVKLKNSFDMQIKSRVMNSYENFKFIDTSMGTSKHYNFYLVIFKRGINLCERATYEGNVYELRLGSLIYDGNQLLQRVLELNYKKMRKLLKN